MSNELPENVVEVRVPEGWAQGAYANGLTVWSCETDMTFDFLVNTPPEMGSDENGKQIIVLPQQIVARIKLSPSMAVHVGMQIAQALASYEERYGGIATLKDQPPLIPPSLEDEEGSDDV